MNNYDICIIYFDICASKCNFDAQNITKQNFIQHFTQLMKRSFLSFLLITFTSVWTQATDITSEQALQEALQFMTNKMSIKGNGHRAPSVTPQMRLAGRVNGLYLFNVTNNNGGFVIVSNDDCTEPVLGYSDTATLDPENMPENMRAWLKGYADEIAWAKKHPSAVAPSPKLPQNNTKAPIAPLLKTTWSQSAPYNKFCPEYKTDKNAATGCVATAMAQCMYLAESRVGSTTTYTTSDIPGYMTNTYDLLVQAVPAGSPIDWYRMHSSYDTYDAGTSVDAMARLMQYCGTSIRTDYGLSSSTNTKRVATALRNYFGYKNTVTYVERSLYTYEEWIDILYNELSQGRAICYGGQSTGGGHDFVCDGYQAEDFFHINWGWGGMSDNYFKLSALNPQSQGIGASSSNDGYNFGQEAVIGIQKAEENGTLLDIEPANIDKLLDHLRLNSISIDKDEITGGESVTVTLNVTNCTDRDFDGDLYVYSQNPSLVVGKTFLIPAGATKNCQITFTPKDNTATYILQPLLAYRFWDGTQAAMLHVKGSGIVTTDNVPLSVSNLQVRNYEKKDGAGIVYSKNLNATISFENATSENYFERIQVDVYDDAYNLKGRAFGQYCVLANSTLEIPLVTTGLNYGENYRIFFCYVKNGVWVQWTKLLTFECRPGIIITDALDQSTVMQPSQTIEVPENAISVDMTDCGVTTVIKNSNPNTLYILGSTDTLPSGLNNINVVRGDGKGNYTAENILLKDNLDFGTPVNFVAEKVEFVYQNQKQADGTNGWNTLMLPFRATQVTADNAPINWFRSKTDDNGQFWMKRFTDDTYNTVYFDYESNDYLEANTPYIIALPNDHSKNTYNLSDKTIRFIGENTIVHKADRHTTITAHNYRFTGSTHAVYSRDIYSLNATGNRFQLANISKAFRAYFKSADSHQSCTSLSIGTDEVTGIDSIPLNLSSNDEKNVYTLDGRCVQESGTQNSGLTKGLYIVNGKKVVIK